MKSLVVVVAFVVVVAAFACEASECGFPPSMWCSSPDVAKRCNAFEACQTWQNRNRRSALGKKLVNVTLAYESYCGACREFITGQLFPTYQLLKDYMTVDLLPYGNAEENYNPTTGEWSFQCQHGRKECKGNMIETCAIYMMNKDESKYFPFIHCMEANDPVNDAQKCAAKFQLDWHQISACVNGTKGNLYQHLIAMDTPPHGYVPWILFNGVDDKQIQTKARNDLKGLVCDTLPDPKPSACSSKIVESDKCWRKFN